MKIGRARQHFAETDSTNRVALDWIDAPDGALVSADSQTAGRGRLGRSWQSAAGKGLYFSLVLRPREPAPARYALLAGLGVARGIEGAIDAAIQCKWPNDILCNARKIGGILCEARDARLVVGIGINLTHTRQDLPDRPSFPASSLLLETGGSPRAQTLLDAILLALETALEQADWRADYEGRMWGINEVARADGEIGVVSGIESDGRLRLQTANGPRLIVAGELEYI